MSHYGEMYKIVGGFYTVTRISMLIFFGIFWYTGFIILVTQTVGVM